MKNQGEGNTTDAK